MARRRRSDNGSRPRAPPPSCCARMRTNSKRVNTESMLSPRLRVKPSSALVLLSLASSSRGANRAVSAWTKT
eukprot:4716413-Amphidinium_carterae.2